MFAGPNGSGKSTLKSVLPPALLGVYLNPDEIEAGIRRTGFLRLADFGLTANEVGLLPFLASAPLLVSKGLSDKASRLRLVDDRLEFEAVEPDAYFASAIVDFLRKRLVQKKATFTFETVMSHISKVDLLKTAQQSGYRTYLYYVATDDPAINVSRVRNRVRLGGHPVPEDRIVPRYHRSLDLLIDAIRHANRAYIFDNSGENSSHTWLAEISEGRTLELKTDQIPGWFKRSVLDKVSSTD
jgi:predicted ABC-type ATPase